MMPVTQLLSNGVETKNPMATSLTTTAFRAATTDDDDDDDDRTAGDLWTSAPSPPSSPKPDAHRMLEERGYVVKRGSLYY